MQWTSVALVCLTAALARAVRILPASQSDDLPWAQFRALAGCPPNATVSVRGKPQAWVHSREGTPTTGNGVGVTDARLGNEGVRIWNLERRADSVTPSLWMIRHSAFVRDDSKHQPQIWGGPWRPGQVHWIAGADSPRRHPLVGVSRNGTDACAGGGAWDGRIERGPQKP